MKSYSGPTWKEFRKIFPWNWEPRSSLIPIYGAKKYLDHVEAHPESHGEFGEIFFEATLGQNLYHTISFYAAVYGASKLLESIY